MIQGFLIGFTAYAKAARMVSRHGLWGYVLVPGLISLLLGAAILSGAWAMSDDISGWAMALYPFEWGKGAIEHIIQVFGGAMVIILGLLAFKHLVMAITSPVMSLLSEKVEKILRGGQPQSAAFSIRKALSDLARGLALALRNLLRELGYTALLLLLGLLLPFLSPAITLLIFMVQAYYAGFGNLDFTMERYFDVKGSVTFAKSNRGLCLGNGTAFLLLLFTGLGFLFALPLGTIAATIEGLKALDKQGSPS